MKTLERRRPGALPPEYSSFVDRRTQLAAARTALGETRLLTLLGPGGVGKTRFAIRLSQSVRKLYPAGLWFIDLSGVSATGSVVDEVNRIVGAQGVSGDGAESIAQFFGDGRGLLVLDNCEQVVDQCAELVSGILLECPGISVIATSRALLRIAPERVFQVEPLEPPDPNRETLSPAVSLFLDRSASVLPDPSVAELEAIAEICRRLDGMPLAIELAAARVRVISPAQILERLAEPLGFLSSGHRDLPDRQQTIRAAITWSYDLCTDVERGLLRRMSVFVGSWELDAVEWMCGSEGNELPLDIVQSLLDKSIILRRPSNDVVYFGMLDTVRRFGIEQSTPDELQEARSRMRDWYLARLARLEAEWYGPNQAYWLALTRTELPNIRAALEFCIASGDAQSAARLLITGWRVVWQAHGRTDELYRWALRVLELGIPQTPEGAQLLTMLGVFALGKGEAEPGMQRIAQAEALAEQLDDDYSRALVLHVRALVSRGPGSLELLYEALRLEGGSTANPARSNLEETIAIVEYGLGDEAAAERRREALIARSVRAGESFETAFMLTNSGTIATRKGDFESAIRMLRQALSLNQNLENPFAIAMAEETLADAAAGARDFVRAATLLGITDGVGGSGGVMASFVPNARGFRAAIIEPTVAALGVRAYEAAYARGRALTEAEGIAYGLGAQLPGGSAARPSSAGVGGLSARESQVAALVGQGLTDRQIADRLVISRRTAEGHVANSLTKLGFTSRAQLAAWSRRPDAMSG
ncbi:ATP-binding protein [Leifsonia sp. McL0607]|uniref:ATP-binding protein n=1 Tax=Leifsonia sp. McL0607 TaxID=3415672 RepID=UPI003CF2DC4F